MPTDQVSHVQGAIMKFDFDLQRAPGVVKMVGVMRALVEAKREPNIFTICAAARQVLTPEEIAALPPAPEIPGEGKVSEDGVIAWSAFLLWASLRGDI
jgi:hypothetical protein